MRCSDCLEETRNETPSRRTGQKFDRDPRRRRPTCARGLPLASDEVQARPLVAHNCTLTSSDATRINRRLVGDKLTEPPSDRLFRKRTTKTWPTGHTHRERERERERDSKPVNKSSGALEHDRPESVLGSATWVLQWVRRSHPRSKTDRPGPVDLRQVGSPTRISQLRGETPRHACASGLHAPWEENVSPPAVAPASRDGYSPVSFGVSHRRDPDQRRRLD